MLRRPAQTISCGRELAVLTAGARCVQAFLIEHDNDTVGFVGNRTECALLMLLRSWGVSYEALREVRPIIG